MRNHRFEKRQSIREDIGIKANESGKRFKGHEFLLAPLERAENTFDFRFRRFCHWKHYSPIRFRDEQNPFFHRFFSQNRINKETR